MTVENFSLIAENTSDRLVVSTAAGVVFLTCKTGFKHLFRYIRRQIHEDALREFRNQSRLLCYKYFRKLIERGRDKSQLDKLQENLALLVDRYLSPWLTVSIVGPMNESKRLVADAMCEARDLYGISNIGLSAKEAQDPWNHKHLIDIFYDLLLTGFETKLTQKEFASQSKTALEESEKAHDVLRLRDDIFDCRPAIEDNVRSTYEHIRRNPDSTTHYNLIDIFAEQYVAFTYLTDDIARKLARAAGITVVRECRHMAQFDITSRNRIPWNHVFESLAYPVRDRVLSIYEDNYPTAA